MPRRIMSDANSAMSQERPARMYCAPLSSAVISGWMPIWPTMVLSRSASSLNSGPAPVGRSAPLRNSSMTVSGSSSARMTATLASCTSSSAKTSLATSIIQSRLRLPPAMPLLPRMTGQPSLLAGLDHVTVVGLHGLALEIFGAGAQIIGTCIHRAGVGDDGVDVPLQRFFQGFLWDSRSLEHHRRKRRDK